MQLWNNSLHSNMIHLLVSLTEMNYESRPYSLKLKENHTHTHKPSSHKLFQSCQKHPAEPYAEGKMY